MTSAAPWSVPSSESPWRMLEWVSRRIDDGELVGLDLEALEEERIRWRKLGTFPSSGRPDPWRRSNLPNGVFGHGERDCPVSAGRRRAGTRAHVW